MLETYRSNAAGYMRKQVDQFQQLSPSDQREFLFFMMANMAIGQSAIIDSMVVSEPAELLAKEPIQ